MDRIDTQKGITASVEMAEVIRMVQQFEIELSCWGFGNAGTRFGTFAVPGAARNIYEQLEDAAYVKGLTGACRKVAVCNPKHVVPGNAQEIGIYARDAGIRIGAINPMYYGDQEHMRGSLCNPDRDIRKRAVDVSLESIEIARITGSEIISLWLPDGTNYPGQDSIIERKHDLTASLREIYSALAEDMRLLIEYKIFEPTFYHTDLADWGMSYAFALKLGPKAQVLVDLGHHAPGTNIEHIVAFLADEGKIGGFHFNSKKYADDDLIVGAMNPYELFLIFHELIGCGLREASMAAVGNIAYLIDQSHCVEDKIEATLRSVLNIQCAYAKALLVNRAALRRAQVSGDVLDAHRILNDAYETDTRPIVAAAYEMAGLDPDPVRKYRMSLYRNIIQSKRV